MGVQRFEDLRVWQQARDLAVEVGKVLQDTRLQEDSDLAAHLNRASLSTAANIAEGFMRASRREFNQFLRIAAGSNGEVRTLLYICQGRGTLPADACRTLIERTESIGRMLRVLQRRLSEPVTRS